MPLQWLAADLLTGKIICELPSITSEDPFRRVIGQLQTSNAVLTIPADGSIDPDWERALEGGASVLHAYTGDPGQEQPHWSGVVMGADRGLTNQVPIRMVTGEGLLDRRFGGEYTTDPTGVGATKPQNQIVADVVTQFAADVGGFPITVVQLPDPPGVTGNTARQATFHDYEDRTVLSILSSLMGYDGGPEWTVKFFWNHSVTPNTITPYLYVGTRIGTPATAGLGPNVTFDETQCLSPTFFSTDYGQGKGANVLTALSPGQGLGRLQETVTAPANGRPKYEYRWTPTTSDDAYDPTVLTSFATSAAAVIGDGVETLTLTFPFDMDGHRLGTDWDAGDDIGYSLQSVAIPTRREGVVRVVGYECTNTTVTPLLAQPGGFQ